MRRLALVWVCCAVALAGCSKPAERPGTLPPLSSHSPSASPSPSPDPASAAPADAKAAIVALAKAYYAETNTAIRTGSTKALRNLAVPGCPCNAVADHVDRDWKRGTVPVPAYYNVSAVEYPLLRSTEVGFVTVIYTTNGYRVLDKSGRSIVEVPPLKTPEGATVECHRVSGVWKVADIVRN